MKLILVLIFLASHFYVFAQVDFNNIKVEPILYREALSADSAIVAGEFGEIHGLLVIQNGQLLFEKYYNGWTQDSIHQLQSATKSVISALLGCALQEGFVKSVEDPISEYFTEYTFTDPLKRQITIRDLLTQRHGLKWIEGAWNDPENSWRKIISSEGNWYNRILDTPMDTIPGTKFIYSNAAPVLISGLIQNAAKMNIDSFAKQYLFDKLDIHKYWFWQGNGGPSRNGMALIALTSRDMAKLGQLYFQQGVWKDQQILPKSYVKESTSGIVKGVGLNGAYKQYDYGYLWWCNPVSQSDKYSEIFLARGAGGQNIIVEEKRKLVIVITAWNMQQPNKPQLIYDRYFDDSLARE